MADRILSDSLYQQVVEALERLADPRNIHFGGDTRVVAREALAALSVGEPKETHPDTKDAQPASPEVTAEQYIAQMIDRGPEPLRRLADWLSQTLDEDEWKTAERMLLGAYEAAGAAPGEGGAAADVLHPTQKWPFGAAK